MKLIVFLNGKHFNPCMYSSLNVRKHPLYLYLIFFLYRSKDLWPSFSRLAEVRSLIPPGPPCMACTITATKSVREVSGV
jgi:hypothetical protein